jgi:diguanylate cyclase (GGDEF)-like protein
MLAPSARPVASPGTGDAVQMSELLDVSRRLASITSVDEIHRVIAREAMGLVHASSAALIVREDGHLVIAHEGRPGLLVAERLQDGAIGRVAETGQPTRQVSATEAAIRQLPAALLAVPLVAGGAVAAVLVLLRPATTPFSAADADLLMALTPVAAAAMHGAAQSTEAMQRSLQDALTGVGNRSRFDRDLAVITQSAGWPVTLVMIDLDHFKAVNDAHGHPAGDALLQGLGGVLRRVIRPSDGVYRYGGEEFALLMPNTPSHDAAELAERIRHAVETSSFEAGPDLRLTATASVGVATADSGDGSTLVALADAALYEAKRTGRNRVCVAAPSAGPNSPLLRPPAP